MAGFKFQTGAIEIEIEGKRYPVDTSDPKTQQKALDFSMRLMGTSLEDVKSEMFEWVSNSVHTYVSELLGEDAEAEIFKDRKPDLIEELRLFTYIQEQISKDRRLADLERALGRYSAKETL